MSTPKQKSFLTRWFSRKPKRAFIPLKIAPLTLPFIKPAHKPCFYIPTEESPWAVIVWNKGKWEFESTRHTRAKARNLANLLSKAGQPARVVRAMIPTR